MAETTVSAHDRIRDGQLEHVRQHSRHVDSPAGLQDELPPEDASTPVQASPDLADEYRKIMDRPLKPQSPYQLRKSGHGPYSLGRSETDGHSFRLYKNPNGSVTFTEVDTRTNTPVKTTESTTMRGAIEKAGYGSDAKNWPRPVQLATQHALITVVNTDGF